MMGLGQKTLRSCGFFSVLFFSSSCSRSSSISSFIKSKSKSKSKSKCFFSSSLSFSNSNSNSKSNSRSRNLSSFSPPNAVPPPLIPFSGLEDVMMGYLFGKIKATQLAHSVWKHVVQKWDGDAIALVDATCGNGHDTLAMLKLVSSSAHHNNSPLTSRVYAFDIQKTALHNTMSLLVNSLLHPHHIKLVHLFHTCHSRMDLLVPKAIPVKLVAFNLGYLPGGDKTLITTSETTILGLDAAHRILAPGGLITLVVYVGHPGGIEELERVEAFASGLPVDNWICCKLQMINKPLAPMLVLMFKREILFPN